MRIPSLHSASGQPSQNIALATFSSASSDRAVPGKFEQDSMLFISHNLARLTCNGGEC
jgi:hypothetical protein